MRPERDGFGPDPAFHDLVAERDAHVVGYLLHHPGYDTDTARRLMFIVDLFVSSSARGLGVGAALVEAARVIAADTAAAQLLWPVDRRNTGAMRFYAGLGAQRVEALDLMCLDV